jgi:hypothetical protein
MTAEQIAFVQLWITGLAIFLGPAVGVVLTVWFQRRHQKRDAKLKLFLGLMAERKSYNFALQARFLNTIDVVFADNQKVVDLWHLYYSLTSRPPSEERGHTWLALLSAMAEDLGYDKLSQIAIDQFYLSDAEGQQIMAQLELQKELLRVLKNTKTLAVEPLPAPQAAPRPALPELAPPPEFRPK